MENPLNGVSVKRKFSPETFLSQLEEHFNVSSIKAALHMS
jgi:hypothetical protein